MPDQQPHARAFDLPGWPCPPRVRDIPNHHESWGWVAVHARKFIAQDELGYLWADGAVIPEFRLPVDNHDSPGAVVCWTEHGLGVWIHAKSLKDLPIVSRLDMEPDRWVPIAVALHEPPAFVKAAV